jgi:hypothetical protein
MTRLEKVINAVNWKHPGEIQPEVAKHLIEMDNLYQYLIYDDEPAAPSPSRRPAAERVFSSNGIKSDPKLWMTLAERKKIGLKLAAYRERNNLTVGILAKLIVEKTGHHIHSASIKRWTETNLAANHTKARIIEEFLDIVDT